MILHKIKKRHLATKDKNVMILLDEAKWAFNKIVAPQNLAHSM